MNTPTDDLAFEFMAEMREEWRSVPKFPDYVVSSFGRVRSLLCFGTRRSGNVMRPARRNGYQGLLLYKNKRVYRHSIHRLVCEAFHGSPAPGMFACHNDDKRNNNRASNLRWDTPKANALDRDRNGRGWRKVR